MLTLQQEIERLLACYIIARDESRHFKGEQATLKRIAVKEEFAKAILDLIRKRVQAVL